MAKMDTLVNSSTETVLVFGGPKSGKTEIVGGLSKHFDLIWLDLEKGSSTLFKRPKEDLARIELIKIPDTSSNPVAIDTLLKLFTAPMPAPVCEAHGKVKCMICTKAEAPMVTIDLPNLPKDTIVVVDSLTQLGLSALAHLTKGKPASYSPTWDDYAAQGNNLERVLSAMQQANYNLCVITHVVETKLADNKIKLTPLCGTKNHSATVAKYFGHVVYLDVLNKKHVAGSGSTFSNQAVTGSRTDIAIESGDSLADIFRGKVKRTNPVTKSATTNKVDLAKLKAKVGGK